MNSNERGWAAAVMATVAVLSGCAAESGESEAAMEEEVGEAEQALVWRANLNSDHENVTLVQGSASSAHRQTFVNNFDSLYVAYVAIGGNVTDVAPDKLTFKLYDGCGVLEYQRTVDIDTSGLTSEGAWKWVEIPTTTVDAQGNVTPVAMTYGAYYHFEVSTERALGTSAKIVLNANRYEHGRYSPKGTQLAYPFKKQDIMFFMNGQVDEVAHPESMPTPATNVACPGKCQPIRPESVGGGARNHFNVIVQEKVPTDAGGSFAKDKLSGVAMQNLYSNIFAMLEGTAQAPGVRETSPYSGIYSSMNFYVAIQDIAADPHGDRGGMYCANIDAAIDVVTSPNPFPHGGGGFRGAVIRPAWNAQGWGANMRSQLLHELLGHGIGQLGDEYVSKSGLLAPVPGPYMPNSDVIGCPTWCSSFKPLAVLQTEMASDPEAVCWSHTDQECLADSGPGGHCYFLDGSLPDIPYFEGHKCIPRSVPSHDIGVGCAGNSGCYIGAPFGATGKDFLNVAQPNGWIMQSTHAPVTSPGFSTGPEDTMRQMLRCMFPMSCAAYSQATCSAFQAKWDGSTPGYLSFAKYGNGCENGVYRRR